MTPSPYQLPAQTPGLSKQHPAVWEVELLGHRRSALGACGPGPTAPLGDSRHVGRGTLHRTTTHQGEAHHTELQHALLIFGFLSLHHVQVLILDPPRPHPMPGPESVSQVTHAVPSRKSRQVLLPAGQEGHCSPRGFGAVSCAAIAQYVHRVALLLCHSTGFFL